MGYFALVEIVDMEQLSDLSILCVLSINLLHFFKLKWLCKYPRLFRNNNNSSVAIYFLLASS